MKKMLTLATGVLIGLMMANHAVANKTKKPYKKEASAKASLLETKDPVYNFGTIEQGKPVTTTFSFTNTGNKILAISNVTTSCGCTTPEWDENPVLPGKTTRVKVGYNAASVGSFHKTITVVYGNGLRKDIFIQGDVEAKM